MPLLLLPLLVPPSLLSTNNLALQSIGIPLSFVLVHPAIHIPGYQLYAVEKWIVQRNRPVTLLAVYTGNPDHTISVAAIAPSPSLSKDDALAQWNQAIHHLRRDGARPKETPQGVLMTTSLAHFRSDYTIVHIPNGDFLAVKDQLYTNINLLRMGCSGRSALTLEEPSDTTKERFISMYHLPDTTHFIPPPVSSEFLPLPPSLSNQTSASSASASPPSKSPKSHLRLSSPTHGRKLSKSNTSITLPNPTINVIAPTPNNSWLGQNDRPPNAATSASSLASTKQKDSRLVPRGKGRTKDYPLFCATVLELVKLVQAGLSIFGIYGVGESPLPGSSSLVAPIVISDGLLCDVTVEGIQKWTTEIGEPCVALEPMERIADPMFVSALLSLVLSIRNKLAALGFSHVVPKDPFLHPQSLTIALSAFTHSSSPTAMSSANNSRIHIQGPSFASPNFPANYASFIDMHPHYHHHHNPSISTTGLTNTTITVSPIFTRDIVDSIEAAYDSKSRTSDSRKVRRVLRGKFDDLTSAVAGTAGDSDGGAGGGTLSGGEGGQPLLSSIASGLGRLGSGSATSGGAAAILSGTTDLASFITILLGKDLGASSGSKRGRERKGHSVDLGLVGLGYVVGKEKDWSIAGSVRALWAGRVLELLRAREAEEAKGREALLLEAEESARRRAKNEKEASKGDIASDDDADYRPRSDGRSTEEESDVFANNSFGGLFGERVQKKLGSWAALSRRKGGSLDISTTSLPAKGKNDTKYPETSPQSLLPPIVFAGEADREQDDDDLDLLSSGQVSPTSDYRPTTFNTLRGAQSGASSNINHSSDVKERIFDRRGGIIKTRISSWADPLSARDVVDSDLESIDGREKDLAENNRSGKRRATRHRTDFQKLGGGVTENEDEEFVEHLQDVHANGLDDGQRSPLHKRRLLISKMKKRRSFHDLDSWQGVHVLPLDRMRIDVELCGQMLIMMRRQQHLHNVVASLHILTASLGATNASLREDHNEHAELLQELDARTKVLADIENENVRADKLAQATNILRYEAEQFDVAALWHAAYAPRAKVMELRERVFGAGRRRLPAGVQGAHGRFNRLQWSVDGSTRLVDYLGRTEAEAEAEARCIVVDEQGQPLWELPPPAEDEDDVVEHPGIKPIWLLRFLTSWVARWGAGRERDGNAPPVPAAPVTTEAQKPEQMSMTNADSTRNSPKTDDTIQTKMT